MATERAYTVTIRAEVIKKITVIASNPSESEKIAHGLFTLDECDSHSIIQETFGPIVRCNDLLATKHRRKPWVVVDHPGTDDEKFVKEFSTFELALKCKSKRLNSDIMKRSRSNLLTTEY